MKNDHRAKSELLKFASTTKFARPCAVTLTMKAGALGEKNDQFAASRNYRHFRNRLNAKLLGSAAKRYGRKLRMFVVMEQSVGGLLHYHAVIDRPEHCAFDDFSRVLKDLWLRTNLGNREIDVQDNANDGWLSYMLKSRQKASLHDAIDWTNCHLPAE